MGTDGENLSGVENTPPMSGSDESSQATPAAANYLTKDDLSHLLGDFEKRLKQSNADVIQSTVNKALQKPRGKQPEQPQAQEAPEQPEADPTPPQTEQPVEEPEVPTEEEQPLAQHLEWLKADGIDIAGDVDPLIVEAYKIQEQYGVHLTGQPELDMIDPSSRGKYLASVEDAVIAAVARMKEEGTYAKHIDTNESFASAPGLTAGKTVRRAAHAKMDGADTLELAFGSE